MASYCSLMRAFSSAVRGGAMVGQKQRQKCWTTSENKTFILKIENCVLEKLYYYFRKLGNNPGH